MNTDTHAWYSSLIKPTWAPPSWIFGPVWTVLYAIISITYGYVLYKVFRGELPRDILLPFILNIIANAAFTPLQFWLKNNYLATLDILLVLTTLIWALYAIYPHHAWVAYANIPYLLWVSFATILQITITILNHTV